MAKRKLSNSEYEAAKKERKRKYGEQWREHKNILLLADNTHGQKVIDAYKKLYAPPYFTSPLRFWECLGVEDGSLLLFLIYWYEHIPYDEAEPHKGWFYCTCDTMNQRLGMARTTQWRSLKRLESNGFIKMRVERSKAEGKFRDRRWLQLNLTRIARIVR